MGEIYENDQKEEEKQPFPQVDDIFDERILTDPNHALSSLNKHDLCFNPLFYIN